MKSKKWIFFGISLVIAGLILTAWALNFQSAPDKPEQKVKKQKYPFYKGLEPEPKYSKSVIEKTKSRYVFEPVLQGDLVRHDFMLKNETSEPLELKKVRSCCGSLVENYSRRIDPGQTGVIAAVLLTDRYGGQEMSGIIQAVTGDPDAPEITIDFSCRVKKFADISVYRIMLNGPWHQPIEGTSIVIPAEAYPFTITGIKPRKGIDILYNYEEIRKEGKKAYRITVKNKRKKSGVIRDILFIQTDHPERPEFKIRVQGIITD
jgi:hypothetical protein